MVKNGFFYFFWKKSVFDQKRPQNIFFQKSQYNSLNIFFENKQNGFDIFFTKRLLLVKTVYRPYSPHSWVEMGQHMKYLASVIPYPAAYLRGAEAEVPPSVGG